MALFKDIIRDCGITNSGISTRLLALSFSLIFGAAGLFLFTHEFLTPWLESRDAKQWTSTDATVIKSELLHNEDSKKIEFKYRYHFNGETYKNDRFELTSGGRHFSTKPFEDAVKNHPKGSSIKIWVDPENPQQSVFNRNMIITHWIGLAGSIPFITIGISGVLYALSAGFLRRTQQTAWKEAANIADRHSMFEISKRLQNHTFHKQEYSDITFLKRHHLTTSLGLLFLNLFVNGILSVFLVLAVHFYQEGDTPIFLTLFLIPFCIIGLSLFLSLIKNLLTPCAPDYLIISTWDWEFQWIEISWLLLHNQKNEELFALQPISEKHVWRAKKTSLPALENTFHTPDKTLISGQLRLPFSGSSEKSINLIIHTKSKNAHLRKHSITLFTPSND